VGTRSDVCWIPRQLSAIVTKNIGLLKNSMDYDGRAAYYGCRGSAISFASLIKVQMAISTLYTIL